MIIVHNYLIYWNYQRRNTRTYHLRELLKQGKVYIWTETHDQFFINLKQSLSIDNSVSYFDNFKKRIIYKDASPYEVFADFLQKLRNHKNRKSVAYTSKPFTSV